MPAARFRLISPQLVADFLHTGGGVCEALHDIAGIAGVELAIAMAPSSDRPDPPNSGPTERETRHLPLQYRGREVGGLRIESGTDDPLVQRAAQATRGVVEHMVQREAAVGDLADALMTGYEELNLLYSLLPTIATKVDPREIGEVLVAETARTLGCRRVSLLILDEKKESFKVLASRGVPADVQRLSMPVRESIAAESLCDNDLFVVNDITKHPNLVERSRGEYDSSSFVVVRVPLLARGEALGFLTATEREGGSEFTARDRKLIEGLSAMGASALMNCHLHAAVNKQMMSTIHALASAVDAKDHYTHDHAGRVAQLCVATARALGRSDSAACREVQLAGLLHDIGKIGIPDAILSKPASLTPAEYKTIQSHVQIGARIVAHVPGLEGVAKAILHHHERFDGFGYPSGLSGEAIPLASALIAVADTFDSLTSDRPYRQAGTLENALRELQRCKGSQFDPGVVDAFASVIRREMSAQRAGTSTVPQVSELLALRPPLTVQ